MAGPSTQLVMPFAPVVSYEPDDFIAGEASRAALAMVRAWPDWPYSIMLLHGPHGCGKTHLAHVFARAARASFIAPGRLGQQPADQLLTGGHSWILDGIEQVKDQAALAQLINHARARGDYLLLTATKAAAQLSFTLPDLQSRLRALPALEMGAPDDALLRSVLAKAFADRQLRIAPNILDYAVTHLERSYEAAAQFAEQMDRASLAQGRAVTLALVRRLLNQPPSEIE